MPLMHCIDCHHEWESTSENSLCDWCGGGAYVLESKTSLEKFCEKLKNPKYRKKLLEVFKNSPKFTESSSFVEPADKRWREKKR